MSINNPVPCKKSQELFNYPGQLTPLLYMPSEKQPIQWNNGPSNHVFKPGSRTR